MVELVTEANQICSFGIEREVDCRALRTQRSKRRGEGARPTPALERNVGAVVSGPVPPALLQCHSGIVVRIEGHEAERLGERAPAGLLLHNRYLFGTVLMSQQGRKKPNETRACDHDSSTLDPFAEPSCSSANKFGGGVQESVRTDWSEVSDVDAEEGIEIGRKTNDMLVKRVADMCRGVPVRRRNRLADLEGLAARLSDAGDLHIAETPNRVPRGACCRPEQSEFGIEL